MSRKANLTGALAVAIIALSGVAGAYDDKSPRSLKDPVGGIYEEGYVVPDRPAGVQIFVGTPHAYNGYRPYYGPYMYGPIGPRGGGIAYVGPGYGYGNGSECRRWAWALFREDKWPWSARSGGEWRCAEW